MSLLRKLCCALPPPKRSPSPESDPADESTTVVRLPRSSRAPATGGAPIADSDVLLPRPSILFIRYLADNPNTPARDLLKPYLKYELWLRGVFAKGAVDPDRLANLVPIYAGHQGSLRLRLSDRSVNDPDKYIMPLLPEQRGVDGAPAIVPSLEEYKRNLSAFSHAVLKDLNWSNVVVAGSAALLPLLPRRTDVKLTTNASVVDPMETYYQVTAKRSDVDLFFYGISEDEAVKRIFEIEAVIRTSQRLEPGTGMTLRTKNAITFISPRWPYRHIQVVLRLYRSISEILTGFDVDCSCVAFDGQQVYSNPRGIAAIATRTNIIDVSRRSPSYEYRLHKYRRHNFDVYWDDLDRSQISIPLPTDDGGVHEMSGLAKLMFFEKNLSQGDKGRPNKPRREYRQPAQSEYARMETSFETTQKNEEPAQASQSQQGKAKRFEYGQSTSSGYTSVKLPYGKQYTATKVRTHVKRHANEQLLFGTVAEVVEEGAQSTNENNQNLAGRVSFLKQDAGRSRLGSFYPLSEEDWTKQAYSKPPENGLVT